VIRRKAIIPENPHPANVWGALRGSCGDLV
jgi:hypothetical protein